MSNYVREAVSDNLSKDMSTNSLESEEGGSSPKSVSQPVPEDILYFLLSLFLISLFSSLCIGLSFDGLRYQRHAYFCWTQ